MCEALRELLCEMFPDEIKARSEAAMLEGERRGRLEGEQIGRLAANNQLNTLIVKLSELGRIDEIVKSAKDTEYQQKLLAEFKLI